MPSTSDSQTIAGPDLEEGRRRGGRANEIRSVLQEEIETGKLPPGAPLDERALAARFQVSRTPVREALQQLTARDLVRIVPRQGVIVSRLSISKVRAMMESVGELEALCAKLAARRVDEKLKHALDDAIGKGQEAAVNGGAADYAIANSLFHEVVYAGSRNEYLAELIRNARRLIQRYRVRDFHNKTQISRSLNDHLKIARAIQEGDEAAAGQAMLLHVPAGSSGFSEFLATIPKGFLEPETDDQ